MTCPKLPDHLLELLRALPDGVSLWMGPTTFVSSGIEDDRGAEIASAMRLQAERIGGTLGYAWLCRSSGTTRYQINVNPPGVDAGGLLWNDEMGAMPALHVEKPVLVSFGSILDHAEAVGDPTVLYPLLYADDAPAIARLVAHAGLVPVLDARRHGLIGRLPLKERVS